MSTVLGCAGAPTAPPILHVYISQCTCVKPHPLIHVLFSLFRSCRSLASRELNPPGGIIEARYGTRTTRDRSTRIRACKNQISWSVTCTGADPGFPSETQAHFQNFAQGAPDLKNCAVAGFRSGVKKNYVHTEVFCVSQSGKKPRNQHLW